MSRKFESFSGRLTRDVIITVLVTMIIISVVVFFVAAAGSLVFSRVHYSDLMDKTKGTMALIMSKVEVSTTNIVDELSWHLASPEMVTETLKYEFNTNRHLNGCAIGFVEDFFPEKGRWFEPYVLNDRDEISLRDIGSGTHDYFKAEWYTRGLTSSEGVWSNPYLDEVGAGSLLCTFSCRVLKQPEGTVAGVFGADLSLEELSDFIEETMVQENGSSPYVSSSLSKEEDHQIYCFIIGPSGDYIVHPDQDRILRTNFYDYAVGEGADAYRKLGDAMRAGASGEEVVYVDGVKSAVYFAPLLQSGWSMGIVVPNERMMRPGFLFGSLIIILILVGLLIVFFICRHAIKKSSSPLIQLAGSARQIAQGHFDTQLPLITTHDEVGLLRDSFENMQGSLARYVRELTETTARNASMESELGVARSIQMSMLPREWPAFPERKDLDIYGSLTPAKAVGGDLFDFRLRDGKLFFCIGDVSGKGIPAALVMTVISSMFRTLSATEDDPASMITAINESMSARNDNLMFVTLFVGVLDLSTGAMQYSNAGHNAPYVIVDGHPRMMEADANVPVGIMPEWAFTVQETTLPVGSMLFLYTDGLTEAATTDGQLFGEERVLELLTGEGADASVQDIITRMTGAVAEFVGDAEQSDDLTMLAIQLLSRK
jgi:sigma-B regulation protein RsbU (phosphoserine phosphatase)